MFNTIVTWTEAHWGVAVWILSAVLVLLLRKRTPEEWVALGERSPRWQGVIRLLRGVGLDPVKVLSAIIQIITGKVPVRVLQAVDVLAPVDPSKVPTAIPPRDGERGAVRVELLVLAMCGAAILAAIARQLGLVAALGVVCLGVAAVVAWVAHARRAASLSASPYRSPASLPAAARRPLGAVTLVTGTMAALSLLVQVGIGCTPQPVPPSDGGPVVVTPSSWVRTARLSVTIGRGLIIPARVIVEAAVSEPGLTRARRAFDVTDRALGGLDLALTAYEARGGDACAVYAASGAAAIALQELAAILVEEGFSFGAPLGRVLDMVASVVDTLVPRCDAADAGFHSAGRAANTHVSELERRARLRGVILRRDLDRIAPELADGGVQ